MNSHPSAFDAAALSLSPAVEARIGKTASMIKAGFSDAARLASERVRRQMGWPGLSQSWGRSKSPSTHDEFQDAVWGAMREDEEEAERRKEAYLEDLPNAQKLANELYQVDPSEQAFHDTVARRRAEDEAKRLAGNYIPKDDGTGFTDIQFDDTPGRPVGDEDPKHQRLERESRDKYRQERREREERQTREEEIPGTPFHEITSDPAAMQKLSDLDVIEFEIFSSGDTAQKFRDEAKRRGL